MKRCPKCNHTWKNIIPKPIQCLKCHSDLDDSSSTPSALLIPLIMIFFEKKRHLECPRRGNLVVINSVASVTSPLWEEAVPELTYVLEKAAIGLLVPVLSTISLFDAWILTIFKKGAM